MIDRERVLEALRLAADNAVELAANIRAELATIGEDGSPDAASRRTKNGYTEDDAREWDIDAEILDDLRERMAGNLWDADLSHAERATPPAHRSGS